MTQHDSDLSFPPARDRSTAGESWHFWGTSRDRSGRHRAVRIHGFLPSKDNVLALAALRRLLERTLCTYQLPPQMMKAWCRQISSGPAFSLLLRGTSSCKNARRISLGVNRTLPSPRTVSRRRAFRVECFVKASPFEFGKSSGL
jgi:hypothetical protein